MTLLVTGAAGFIGAHTCQALAAAGLSPIPLGPKEGLAFINGTQFSTAFALAGLFGAESVFAAALLSEWAGYHLPNIDPSLTTIAHWLIAWGDGFMTGLLSAIFVAFRPQWLATWSDELYLRSS